MVVAVACLVHCVAGPVLLGFAGFASWIGLSERTEPVLLLTSLALGLATLLPGYRRKHGRRTCIVVFACGIVCLAARRWIHISTAVEIAATAAGAGLIVGAHALNMRFSRSCICCERMSAKGDRIREGLPSD